MLEEVFKNYECIYKNILNKFYPSLGSTGFQERNLTVNFSKAFEITYGVDNVISWFELQFRNKAEHDNDLELKLKNKNDNHFDCVIIKESEIYVIEAKRYTTPNKKKKVYDDIERINKFVKKEIDADDRFSKLKNYNVYGVILADVWTESKPKENILKSYNDKKCFEDLKLNKSEYNVIIFEGLGEKSDYALLSFVWEIR